MPRLKKILVHFLFALGVVTSLATSGFKKGNGEPCTSSDECSDNCCFRWNNGDQDCQSFVGAKECVAGGGGADEGGEGYDYKFTCPSGTKGNVPIPPGDCQKEYEQFARVFGCNEVDDFRSACVNLYSCTDDDLSQCDQY